MKTVTSTEARELLKRAVDEKGASYHPANGESLNGGCMYFTVGGGPICIVGHVLHYLGVKEENLKLTFEAPESRHHVPNMMKFGSVLPDNISFTAEAEDLLTSAQQFQDLGSNWGQAYEMACTA